MAASVRVCVALGVLLAAPGSRAAAVVSYPDWRTDADQDSAFMGYSVAGGDLNGDGFADVVSGAPQYDFFGFTNGLVQVHHGSASGPGTGAPDWLGSWTTLSYYGIALATANVNGDAYADLIVGADHYGDSSGPGQVFVYHGSATGLTSTGSPSQILTGAHALDLFGYPVANAGDTNMDGYDDVVVGSAFYTSGQSNEGRFLVYRGSASGLAAAPSFSAESNDPNAWLGYAVAGAGDVNMDGYDDVIVGAHYANNGQTDEGRAWVYLGGSGAFTTGPTWQVEGNEDSAFLGVGVAGIGDVNMDGYDDVAIGASGTNGALGVDSGRVYVFHGSASGLVAAPGWPRDGVQAGGYFGQSVASAGDTNGDGYPDMIVGAIYENGGETSAGRAYLYPGGPGGLATSPSRVMEGDQASAGFGWSVGSAGDVNMDGFADLLVGAGYFDAPEADEGSQFLYYGTGQSLEYTVRKVLDFANTDFQGADVGYATLNARGDVGFSTGDIFGNQRAGFLPRGEKYLEVANDFDAFGFDSVSVYRINASGTLLLVGETDFLFDDFLALWNRQYGLYVLPTTVDLWAAPDLNDAGDVVFRGASNQIRRYRNFALEAPLAGCSGSAYEVQTNNAGQVAFGCGFSPSWQLFLGTTPPIPAVLSAASFPIPVQGPFMPRGLASSGKVLVQPFDARPYLLQGSTLSEVAALTLLGWGVSDPLGMNEAGTIAGLDSNDSEALVIASAPAHRVIGVGDAVGSATISSIAYNSAGLNDHGQLAFWARLSDASQGLFVATPFTCDSDRDGWCDASDDCPSIPDFEQHDLDRDGVGDLCDNCPLAWNADQLDSDMNGRGDACIPCNASGPNAPFCQTLNVPTPGQVFTRSVSLTSLPDRPVVLARTKSSTPGLSADFTFTGCAGGTPYPAASCLPDGPQANPFFRDGTGGRLQAEVYQCYYAEANRIGATCTLTITATGGTGTLQLLVDAATNPPPILNQVGLPDLAEQVTTNEVDFIDEGHSYRLLDAGTGPPNFGACSLSGAGDDEEVTYSSASGPGWDCCTFEFLGTDETPSEVGQLVVRLGTATPPPPDTDMDGYLTPCDHCPHVADDGFDSGGVNSTMPDGISNACQCGDLTLNGVVDNLDVVRLRAILAGNGGVMTADELARCAVIAPASACNLRTLAYLRRGVAVPPRGTLAQACDNALP